MSGARIATLAVRFLCELAMLAGLAYWGFQRGEGALGWVLGIGAPLIAAAMWGLFVSPKAVVPVPGQTRVMIEFFLFGFVALALANAGVPALGVALGLAGIGTSVLNAAQQREAEVGPRPRRS
ncbi:MAG TPA: YrdB family protein [Actinomycetota bacterium]|nr:YrdB family protein [Actinomycetota bacterium]